MSVDSNDILVPNMDSHKNTCKQGKTIQRPMQRRILGKKLHDGVRNEIIGTKLMDMIS